MVLANVLGEGTLDPELMELVDHRPQERQTGFTKTCLVVLMEADRPLTAQDPLASVTTARWIFDLSMERFMWSSYTAESAEAAPTLHEASWTPNSRRTSASMGSSKASFTTRCVPSWFRTAQPSRTRCKPKW